MNKIKVRIIKDKSINLKVNTEIFERIKEKAITKDYFIADYVNLIFLMHLNSSGSGLGFQLEKSIDTQIKKYGE